MSYAPTKLKHAEITLCHFHLLSIHRVSASSPKTQGESSFATFVCGSVFEQLAVAHDLSGKSEFCLSGEVREVCMFAQISRF